MNGIRGWEWIIILLLALLLFGGFKKLPDAARGIGRSLRIFKAETRGLTEDDEAPPPPPPAEPDTVDVRAPKATIPDAPVTPAGAPASTAPTPVAEQPAPTEASRPGAGA